MSFALAELLDAGARIIGGCCGSKPEHVEAIRHALETTPPGGRPTLPEIEAKLGPFSSPDDGAGRAGAPRRERRRRRG